MTLQTFGEQRVQRYNTALKQCPYARVNEIIPILFLIYKKNLSESTLVDLASGTGYLTDVLEPLVKRVIRVDKSPAMLAASQTNRDLIYADIRDVHHQLKDKVDIITCLAALHHVIETKNDMVDPERTEEGHFQVIKNWTSMLAPYGKLLLVDVCLPDLTLVRDDSLTLSQHIERYYHLKQEELHDIYLPFDKDFLHQVEQTHPHYFSNSYLPQLISSYHEPSISCADILQKQHLRGDHRPEKMLSVDFFDEVVANFSIDGHVAYFPRETHLRSIFERLEMNNVLVACFPTPWVFTSEEEGVWFVNELFSLGKEPIPVPNGFHKHADYERTRSFISHFLGMYTEGELTYINWQLIFAYGEKGA